MLIPFYKEGRLKAIPFKIYKKIMLSKTIYLIINSLIKISKLKSQIKISCITSITIITKNLK